MRAAPLASSPSKTATVIVLVVCLQVIVVGVLGLGAISRDRREAARESRERADSEAIADAEGMLARVRTDLDEVLGEALAVASPEDVRRLRSRSSGRMVDLVLQLEDSGTVRWMNGVQRLWLPAKVRLELESRAIYARDDVDPLRLRLEAAQRQGAHAEAVRLLAGLVGTHALRRDPSSVPAGFPDGLAWASALLEHAALARTQGMVLQPPLRQVLLLALEAAAMNSGREGDGDDESLRYLQRIHAHADAAIACEEDRDALQAMLQEFRRAREGLDLLRPALEAVARRYREAERAGGEPAPRQVLAAQGEVLAVERSTRIPDRLVLVRLLPEEARNVALGRLDEDALARGGVRLEVLRSGVEVPGRPLWQQDLGREGTLELPLRVALYRDRLPPEPAGGRSEGFYWGIIGLAAVGLLVGAVVLVRAWQREVHLARLKADFVSNLSHELKTPLTSIALYTELLQDGQLEGEQERAEGLAVLSQESQRLQRIVARMTEALAREARGAPYDLVPGDLALPVREALQRFRRLVTEPGLDLHVHLPAEPLPVRMDSHAIEDAIGNLLGNAWKYKRGDRARIELSARRRGSRVVLSVVDDGVGIPRAERKRVFEMFYRAENYLTREVAGTGLGLALVRSIVRAHRGRIHVEGGPGGVGSAFHLSLPACRDPLPAPQAPAPGSALPSDPSASRPAEPPSPAGTPPFPPPALPPAPSAP